MVGVDHDMKDFNASRREIASLLCAQAGRTWGGLSIEERDALMDAADTAVRARDKAFDPVEGDHINAAANERAALLGREAWAHGVSLDSARAYSNHPHIQAAWCAGWKKADDHATQQSKAFRQSPFG
jgi:hypothetical protein